MSRVGLHSAYCPRCRERVPFDQSGRCLWCDEQTGGAAPAARPAGRYSNAGKPFLMSGQTLLRARALYAEGLSLRAVARELHPETAYRSVDSFRVALEDQFRLRGWQLRDQRAVTTGRNHRHGLAARGGDVPAYRRALRASRSRPCAGVRLQPPRAGSPCRLRAMTGSDYCYAHDPRHEDLRAAQLAGMRARIGRAVA